MAQVRRIVNPTDSPEAAELVSKLDAYLASSLAPSDTVQQLTSVIQNGLGSTPSEDDSDAAAPIYHEILYRARVVRYDDSAQDQLIDLLRHFQSLSPTRIDWPELVPLGMLVRELWNTAPDESTESWTALNAFVARMEAGGLLNFDVYAVWALRSALEDWTPVPGAQDPLDADALNAAIPPAVVWILYAQDKIKELSQKGEEGDRVTRGGPRWTGPSGFSVERWNFWRQRFEEMSNRGDLNEEARALADRAYKSMSN